MADAANPWVSVTNANHLMLDGVPMRIAESFRPKARPKDSLPSGLRFNPAQSKVLDLEYEYKTELGFIKWFEDAEKEAQERAHQKKQQEEARRKQQEEAEKTTTNMASNESASPELTTAQPMKEVPTTVEMAKPAAILPPVTNAILLPQLATSVTVPADSSTNDLSQPVNIKDFENIGEDPFDNLELKTINDMRELETVLANSQTQQAVEEISKREPEESKSRKSPESPIYENPQEVGRDEDNIYINVATAQQSISPQLNNLNPKRPLATPRVTVNPATATVNDLDKSSGLSAHFNVHFDKVNVSKSKLPTITQPNIPVVKEFPKIPPPPVRPKPSVKPASSEGAKHHAVENSDKKISNGSMDAKVQSLANALSKDLSGTSRPPGASKGFSYTAAAAINDNERDDNKDKDVRDIEWPSIEQRSLPPTPLDDKTQPRFYPDAHPAESTQDNVKANLQDSSIVPKTQIKGVKKAGPTRPPPPAPVTKQPNKLSAAKPSKTTSSSKVRRSSKSSTDGQVMESLLSMGFEKAQIDAAVKHLGSDTKELAEHLCAVQQLIKDGVRWQSAQQAIFMCGSDSVRAEKFARAYQQLSEFGFGDDKIKEALISSDMDIQKALDALLVQ